MTKKLFIPKYETEMTFTKHELEDILYSLEGYIQGNDDNELVEKLDGICYRIQRQIEVQSAT